LVGLNHFTVPVDIKALQAVNEVGPPNLHIPVTAAIKIRHITNVGAGGARISTPNLASGSRRNGKLAVTSFAS
jgi:hypothetical protein